MTTDETAPAPAESAQAPAGLHEPLKLVMVGHVDHGKSTVIGRLLYDTDSLPDHKLQQLEQMAERRGRLIEWAFVLDSMQAERDQGVTVDTTQIFFNTAHRNYVIIDAPGHHEFLKNMVSGAASADAAVLVIDAEEGVRANSRRHAYLLHLLGLRQVLVVVNKMDLVDFSQTRFHEVVQEMQRYLAEIGVEAIAYIPVCARDGDNIARRTDDLNWYQDRTLVDYLDSLHPISQADHLPLRLPLQDVYKFDQRRLLVGRVESGILRVGDEILFSPSNKTGVVKSLEQWNVEPKPVEAHAGTSVAITLDEQLFVERGEIVSHHQAPPLETNVFRATVFWLGQNPLVPGKDYWLKLTTRKVRVRVTAVEQVIDTGTLGGRQAERVERNEIAKVTLRSPELLALDEFKTCARTGRFVLLDGYDLAGGGLISMEGYPDQRPQVRASNLYSVDHKVTAESRAQRNGHRGAVLWLTGLSGAGKSTLAMELERRLFNNGCHVYVLDGDNIRAGLNADLGFSPTERAENIRRVGEAAALFADAGFIAITAFISPYQADRRRAREAAYNMAVKNGVIAENDKEPFHEIYVQASLAECERRDVKGLYERARSGEIPDFTGISAPYEAPEAAEVVVDTENQSLDVSVSQIVEYLNQHVLLR